VLPRGFFLIVTEKLHSASENPVINHEDRPLELDEELDGDSVKTLPPTNLFANAAVVE